MRALLSTAAPRRRRLAIRVEVQSTSSRAQIGRWSDPVAGPTPPSIAASRSSIQMWSIWLCGNRAGQVRPITARRPVAQDEADGRAPHVQVADDHARMPGLEQGPVDAADLGERAPEPVRRVHRRRCVTGVPSTDTVTTMLCRCFDHVARRVRQLDVADVE